MANPHEERARERKVFRLVEQIDREATRADVSPHIDPLLILDWLRQLPRKGWAALAKRAGVNVPSTTTQAQVIAVYERRGAEPIDHFEDEPELDPSDRFDDIPF